MPAWAWGVAVFAALGPALMILTRRRTNAGQLDRSQLSPRERLRWERAAAMAWAAPTVVFTALVIWGVSAVAALFWALVALGVMLNAYIVSALVRAAWARRV